MYLLVSKHWVAWVGPGCEVGSAQCCPVW